VHPDRDLAQALAALDVGAEIPPKLYEALAEILASLRGRLPGEVLGVEAERRKGQWVYEFRVVDGNGRLYEVYVDGKSGAIDRIKEK